MIGLMNVDPEPLSLRELWTELLQPVKNRNANPRTNPLLMRSTIILLEGLALYDFVQGTARHLISEENEYCDE
jgi:hypothetical protein